MENYYQEILAQIEQRLKEKEWNKALHLIQSELEMPYIPFDVENQLKQWLNIIKENEKNSRERVMSEEELEEYLNGTSQQQLIAADYLNKSDLRAYMPMILEYLSNEPFLPAATLLIDSCIRQEIKEEMQVYKDGEMISFIPSDCNKIEDSEGFQEVDKLLNQWFQSQEPSFLSLCKTLLFQTFFKKLPQSYKSEEARDLSFSIAYTAFVWMGRESDWEVFFETYKKDSDNLDRIFILPD